MLLHKEANGKKKMKKEDGSRVSMHLPKCIEPAECVADERGTQKERKVKVKRKGRVSVELIPEVVGMRVRERDRN